MSSLGRAVIPRFFLLSRGTDNELYEAWRDAIKEVAPASVYDKFELLRADLKELPAKKITVDCVVSPANSYGIMDGGYDLALSLMFKGKGKEGEKTLTRHCQAALREKWAGYLPPSSCMLMPIPAEVENPLKAKVLAVLPTMRIPEDASWNRDLVYNSMWALLNAIRTHDAPLESVLLTGLGTGTGYVSPKRCAAQMMLAVKHFVEGIPENGTWNDVMPVALEVDKTFRL
ncbi:hypothetical protein EV122DRAFT_206928 [Schizophyllum commune]